MLESQTKEIIKILLLRVLQHGCHDVRWNPAILQYQIELVFYKITNLKLNREDLWLDVSFYSMLYWHGVFPDFSVRHRIGSQNWNRNNTQTKIWKQNHLYFVWIIICLLTQNKATLSKTCVLEKDIKQFYFDTSTKIPILKFEMKYLLCITPIAGAFLENSSQWLHNAT